MADAPHRAPWIEQLFPQEVVSFALDDQGQPPPLMEEEEIWVKGAVEKRRLEFARGRACARQACAELGQPHRPIPKGSEGADLALGIDGLDHALSGSRRRDRRAPFLLRDFGDRCGATRRP